MTPPASAICLILALAVASVASGQVVLERRSDGSIVIRNSPIPASLEVPASLARMPVPAELSSAIERSALSQRLDPRLVRAVVRVESAFDAGAVSHRGAQGLMQLMPATARLLGVHDAFDPEQNLRGGTAYLRALLDRFDGDIELALAGYNAGPEAVARYGAVPPYDETQRYVEKVLDLYRDDGGDPAQQVSRAPAAIVLERDSNGTWRLTNVGGDDPRRVGRP